MHRSLLLAGGLLLTLCAPAMAQRGARACVSDGAPSRCRSKWEATLSGNGKHNVGNMPQHYPYYAEDLGYYYFRPYNYKHIPEQQNAVLGWGGDPRHPYTNREIFDAVYQEVDAPGFAPTPFEPEAVDRPRPAPPAPGAEPLRDAAPIPTPAIETTTRRSNELRLMPAAATGPVRVLIQ